MAVIPYIIQKNVRELKGGKKYWCYEYEQIFVDVSDEVAAFLKKDVKRQQRYQWKIKKQKQDGKIHTEFSLDEVKTTGDGDEYIVADLIEDTVHSENRNPADIAVDKEEQTEDKERAAQLDGEIDKIYLKILTKKQYEAWKYHEDGYNITDISKFLGIDESSVRERLKNAIKRIRKFEDAD